MTFDLIVAITGYNPPVVAPLKAAEKAWPERCPFGVAVNGSPLPAFEGHRYGIGDGDAL